MKRLGWVTLLLALPFVADAQRWKKFRYEAVAGVGASNFLGELGGADQIGTDYFRDLELSLTRPALMVGIRYKLSLFTAIKTTLIYGSVKGDDKLTKELPREVRNLHFKSPIIEISSQFEFSWMKDRVGHRYRLRGVRGQKHLEIYTYGFVGVGAFYFNPKAELDGTWYALQPLGTEGQGLTPSRRKYSRISLAVPFGLGFRYSLNRNSSIGLEFGIRKTFTDYVDDASTTYFNNDAIRAAYGDVAAQLANRNENVGNDQERWTKPGQQRGDPTDKDSYMFAMFSFNLKLRTTRGNLPKF